MKIQVGKIISESFSNFWSHKLEWFRVAFAPIVLYIIGFVILAIAAGGSIMDTMNAPSGMQAAEPVSTGYMLANVINWLISLVAGMSLYINGYRYGIHRDRGDHWWTLQLNWRAVKLFLYMILVGVLMAIYVLISGGIIWFLHTVFESMILNILVGLGFAYVGIYLMIRISLFMPIISMDKLEPFRTSWHLLEGNVFRVFLINLFVMIILFAILLIGGAILAGIGFLAAMVHFALAVPIGIVGAVFLFYMWLAMWAVPTKALSLIYMALEAKK